jgi:hypothetical protein
MSSAPERVRSNRIFNGSTRNGPQAFATARSCGGGLKRQEFRGSLRVVWALLVEAREIIAVFQAMVRRKSQPDLDPWLDRARASLVASFAN